VTGAGLPAIRIAAKAAPTKASFAAKAAPPRDPDHGLSFTDSFFDISAKAVRHNRPAPYAPAISSGLRRK